MLLFNVNPFVKSITIPGTPVANLCQNYVIFQNQDASGNILSNAYPVGNGWLYNHTTGKILTPNAKSFSNVIISSVQFPTSNNVLAGFTSPIVELGQNVCEKMSANQYATLIRPAATFLRQRGTKVAVNGVSGSDYQTLATNVGDVVDYFIGNNVGLMPSGNIKFITKVDTFSELGNCITRPGVDYVVVDKYLSIGFPTALGSAMYNLIGETVLSANITTITTNNFVITTDTIESAFKQKRNLGKNVQQVPLTDETVGISAYDINVSNAGLSSAVCYVGNVITANVVRPSLNMNFLVDSDVNRNPGYTPIAEVMRTLAPQYIRFSGEEAQGYSWATAPNWTPNTHTFNLPTVFPAIFPEYYANGNITSTVMNYDDMWEISNIANAGMINTVCMNSMYNSTNPVSQDLLMETAGRWVKYAKDTGKRAAIWEIGNETDMTVAYNGYTTGSIYAANATQFIANMKAYDANIYTLVNASTADNWKLVNNIPNANAVVIHTYPVYDFKGNAMYGSANVYYTEYAQHDYNGSEFVNKYSIYNKSIYKALGAITKPLWMTETGVVDFSAFSGLSGWPLKNDIARMLMFADMYIAQSPLVDCWCIWTTRWTDTPGTNSGKLFGILGDRNELLPTGYAFLAASKFTRGGGYVVNSYSDNQGIRIMANVLDGKRRFLVVNKGSIPTSVDIVCQGVSIKNTEVYYGNADTFTDVITGQVNYTNQKNHLVFTAKPLSITFLSEI